MNSCPIGVALAFNLSARDVASLDLVMNIRRAIKSVGIDAARICFKITETALMHNFGMGCATRVGLKSLGVKIALDDFRTGFSILHHVHHLPINKIKIDRSFLTDLETNKTSRDIAMSIVNLSRDLDLECIAEGVENPNQTMILRSLGCRTMRGFLFGRPMHDPSQDGRTSRIASNTTIGPRSMSNQAQSSSGLRRDEGLHSNEGDVDRVRIDAPA